MLSTHSVTTSLFLFSGDKSKTEERCEMTHTPSFSSLSCCGIRCPIIPNRLWSRKWKHTDDPRRSSKRQFANGVPLYYSEINRSKKNCRTPFLIRVLHLCTVFSAMTDFFLRVFAPLFERMHALQACVCVQQSSQTFYNQINRKDECPPPRRRRR